MTLSDVILGSMWIIPRSSQSELLAAVLLRQDSVAAATVPEDLVSAPILRHNELCQSLRDMKGRESLNGCILTLNLL